MVAIGDPVSEARRYARAFAEDARALYARSHLHRCTNTCFKHKGGGKPGDWFRWCRMGFCHVFESASFCTMKKPEHCLRLSEYVVIKGELIYLPFGAFVLAFF